MKISIVVEKFNGLFLYNGEWVSNLPNDVNPELFGTISDISKDIYDSDTYKETLLDIPGIWVEYYNHKPDYSIVGNKGGYRSFYKKFDTVDDAYSFIEDHNNKNNDYYRYSIYN